jgi:hypothetical protein
MGVLVSIKDRGSGIDPDIVSKLFSKVYPPSRLKVRDWDYLFAKILLRLMGEKYGPKIIATIMEL